MYPQSVDLEMIVFLLLYYSFLINFVEGDYVEVFCLGAFLSVATVDSSFQICTGLETVWWDCNEDL